jgi:hypothetical protein
MTISATCARLPSMAIRNTLPKRSCLRFIEVTRPASHAPWAQESGWAARFGIAAATASCLSDSVNYDPAEILAGQEHFGFTRPTAIDKDWHILRAMGAIASTGAAPFKFVFAGGTSLARAHKIVHRMS